MEQLEVALGDRSYPIYIGAGILPGLARLLEEQGIDQKRKLLLVSDSQVFPLYGEKVVAGLREAGYTVFQAIVPAGESSKNLEQLESLVEIGIQSGLDRTSVILALGGGVVGDLAGFLAAVYMRGISFVQLPTTLLAHDSSVGGKVGVNHRLGKNMIGAFHQPALVVFDVETLHTLPPREVTSGYAEVIKHALIADLEFAQWLLKQQEGLLRLESSLVKKAILRGCQIKAEIVCQDEQEHGVRALLNYGHTIGHALEAVSGYSRYTHGEAVAIGMVGAALLSEALGLAHNVVLPTRKLLSSFSLPVSLEEQWSIEELMAAIKRDKKGKQGSIHFVLPTKIGQVRLVQDVEEPLIRQVLQMLYD